LAKAEGFSFAEQHKRRNKVTKHRKNFIPSGLDEVFTRIQRTTEALRQAGYYDASGEPRTDEGGQRILHEVRRRVKSEGANETKRRRKEVD
jgi:hypothetical protein